MATRPNSGMDPSPLLPLGVLLAVVVMVFTPLTFQVVPVFMDGAQQMLAFLWIVPVFLVLALILTSSELFNGGSNTSSQYYRRPAYRYPQNQYGGEGPSWGLLGLMLLMLLLLPWRY